MMVLMEMGAQCGALDSDGALKAARFLELCDAFQLPLCFLCDTPGFMVGLESERTAAVRKMVRRPTVQPRRHIERPSPPEHLPIAA